MRFRVRARARGRAASAGAFALALAAALPSSEEQGGLCLAISEEARWFSVELELLAEKCQVTGNGRGEIDRKRSCVTVQRINPNSCCRNRLTSAPRNEHTPSWAVGPASIR